MELRLKSFDSNHLFELFIFRIKRMNTKPHNLLQSCTTEVDTTAIGSRTVRLCTVSTAVAQMSRSQSLLSMLDSKLVRTYKQVQRQTKPIHT